MRNKVLFLVPFFGQKPKYFDYFLQSLVDQPFDLLLVTNIEILEVSNNVFVQQSSFELFSKKIEVQLGYACEIDKPYKLCDYRPAFGEIFSAELNGYDFWGSIDTDVIVGNFKKFINDALLDEIDIYSGRSKRISGSFFMVRNKPFCNQLYKRSKDWDKIIKTSRYLGFDELGGHFFESIDKGTPLNEIDAEIQSFTSLVFDAKHSGLLRTHFEDSVLEPKTDCVTIAKNRVVYQSKDYLTFHLIYFKFNYYFNLTGKAYQRPFYITPLGFFQQLPSLLNVFLSKNFWTAVKKKIEINLHKLKLSKA